MNVNVKEGREEMKVEVSEGKGHPRILKLF